MVFIAANAVLSTKINCAMQSFFHFFKHLDEIMSSSRNRKNSRKENDEEGSWCTKHFFLNIYFSAGVTLHVILDDELQIS